MADVPFGFSAGDDPDPARDKNPNPFGGGDFSMGDLGKIFSQLGAMFSGTGGSGGGPVNYDLARKLASSSIGFTAPIA